MTRSLKKGPYVDERLLKKIEGKKWWDTGWENFLPPRSSSDTAVKCKKNWSRRKKKAKLPQLKQRKQQPRQRNKDEFQGRGFRTEYREETLIFLFKPYPLRSFVPHKHESRIEKL